MIDITLGETHSFKFTTAAPDTGAPTTLSGTPVISAYVDNSTTQITAGITLTVDFDSVTGLNDVTVVATSGNGYTTGTNVALIITTGTVDGNSAVGYKVAEFTIGRSAAFTRLGAPAGASVSADIAAIEAQTDDIGAAGAGLTAITQYIDTEVAAIKAVTDLLPDAGALSSLATAAALATVDSNVDAILADTGTDGVIVASLAANSVNASALAADAVAEINATVDTAISDAALATAANLATVDTVVDAIKVQTDKLTFTVANQLDANIQSVNDTAVTGDGGTGTEWGPA